MRIAEPIPKRTDMDRKGHLLLGGPKLNKKNIYIYRWGGSYIFVVVKIKY